MEEDYKNLLATGHSDILKKAYQPKREYGYQPDGKEKKGYQPKQTTPVQKNPPSGESNVKKPS